MVNYISAQRIGERDSYSVDNRSLVETVNYVNLSDCESIYVYVIRKISMREKSILTTDIFQVFGNFNTQIKTVIFMQVP